MLTPYSNADYNDVNVYILALKKEIMMSNSNHDWFKQKTIYQVWPRSFCDSNDDGVGDIGGIISKLDYLQELGIELIWLSPIFKSPMDDMGYDIADYYQVDPIFGSNDDLQRLIDEAKQRNIGIILDLVVNHTSDEHPWFLEAKKGRDNPYRDYYIWHDPVDGGRPTDQESFFLPYTWTLDEQSGQYYYHLFSKRQPDLNWDNPKILDEVCQLMNFWLAKGIAGFRMDVIDFIGKKPFEQKLASERTHELLKIIHERTFANYPNTIAIGETLCATVSDAINYTSNHDQLDMTIPFEHVILDQIDGKTRLHYQVQDFVKFKQVFKKWQQGLHNGGWNSLYFSNHDQPRPVSRWGNDLEYRVESAKMLATVLHLMQGTPFIYQGEEIGMTNCQFDDYSEFRDVEIINFYNEFNSHPDWSREKIFHAINTKGRDNARTPVQWSAGENAGFSSHTPWIKLNTNYPEINIADDMSNQNSIWHFYKHLIQLRKELPIITYGDFDLLAEDDSHLFAYVRTYKHQHLLVVANFSASKQDFGVPFQLATANWQLLTYNYQPNYPQHNRLTLQPYEAVSFILTTD